MDKLSSLSNMVNSDPFVVNPAGLDMWFYNLGIAFDDPNRLEYLKMYAKPHVVQPEEYDSIMRREAYDHNGTLDINGWAVAHGISIDDPHLFEKFMASDDSVQSTQSREFLEGAADYARMEAAFDLSGDEVPISARATGMLEDAHLDALHRAELAAERGDHSMALHMRMHAQDIDDILHGNNGNW